MGRLAFHGSKHEHLNVIQAVFEARKKKARRVLLSNPIAVRELGEFIRPRGREEGSQRRPSYNIYKFVSFLVDATRSLSPPNGSDFDKERNGVTPLIRNVYVHDAINNGLGVYISVIPTS